MSEPRFDSDGLQRRIPHLDLQRPGAGIDDRYALVGDLSWEIDLFGKLRRSNEAARAELLQGDARDEGWQQALDHFGGWQAYTEITDREFRIFRITPT